MDDPDKDLIDAALKAYVETLTPEKLSSLNSAVDWCRERKFDIFVDLITEYMMTRGLQLLHLRKHFQSEGEKDT